MKYIYLFIMTLSLYGPSVMQAQNWRSETIEVSDDLWFFVDRKHENNTTATADINYEIGVEGSTYCAGESIYYSLDLNSIQEGQRGIVFAEAGKVFLTCGNFAGKSVSTGTFLGDSEVSGLTAEQDVHNTRINIQWNLFSYDSKNADGYLLYRKEGDVGMNSNDVDWSYPHAVILGDVNSYEDNNLKFDQEYSYKIVAFYASYGEEKWMTNMNGTAVKGKTKSLDYSVSAINEYLIKHKIEVSYDVYSGFENKSLYYQILDNGEEVKNSQSQLEDHVSGTTSLWDLALESKGGQTNGIYGALPAAFTGISEDWSLEMLLKIDDLSDAYTSMLLANSSTDILGISINETDPTWILYGTNTGVSVEFGEWINVSLVSESYTTTLYIRGVAVADDGPNNHSAPGFINGDKAHNNFVKDIDIGMVRAWDHARTADQIYDDKRDLYRSDHTLPNGLINEWILDASGDGDSNGSTGELLTFEASGSYSVVWVDAFVLQSETITIGYDHYVKPNTTHSYTLKIFEEGSGKLHSQASPADVNTGNPSTTISLSAANHSDNTIEFTSEAVAEQFRIYRQFDEDDESKTMIATIDIAEDDRGSNQTVTYIDAFDYDSDLTIIGNTTYNYEVVPYYEQTEFEYSDNSGNANITSHALGGLSATAQTSSVDLSWNSNVLSNYTDTIKISRDGEIIARLIGETSYTDEDMIYGQSHVYGILPVKDGKIAFAQYTTAGVNANGEISGWFLDAKNDILLEQVNYDATATINGSEESINLSADQSDGSFLGHGLFYGDSAYYTIDGLEESFTLTREDHDRTVFVKTDSITPAVKEISGNFKITLYDKDQDAYDAAISYGLEPHNLNYIEVITDADLTETYTEDGQEVDVVRDKAIYYNIYRNGELFNITKSINQSSTEIIKDTVGLSGTKYAYKIVAYYYDNQKKRFVHNDTTYFNEYPELNPLTGLTVAATVDKAALELSFSYNMNNPSAFGIDGFNVYRQQINAEQPTLIGTLPPEESNTNYKFTDQTGVPFETYDYHIEIVSGQNVSEPSNKAREQYPLHEDLEDSQVFWHDLESGETEVLKLKFNNSADWPGSTKNVDGVAFYVKHESETDSILVGSRTMSQCADQDNVLYFLGKDHEAYTARFAYYKHNEDGTFFIPFSKVVDYTNNSRTAASFEAENDAHDKNVTEVKNGPGFYKIKWERNAGTSDKIGIQTAKTAIGSDVSNTFLVDPKIGSWAGTDDFTGNTRKIFEFNSSNTKLHETSAFSIGDDINNPTDGFRPIENLVASSDLDEGVFLSWEYPEFSDAEFEIYRDGDKIATITNKFYFDRHEAGNNINANEAYAYQIKAVYDEDNDNIYEQYSARATVSGMRRVKFVVEGHVYDSENVGVPHAQVRLYNQWARTDSTGYYKFDEIYFMAGDNAELTLKYTKVNGSDTDETKVTITFDEETLNYTHDFTTNENYEGMRNTGAAEVFALHAYPDEDAFAINLKLQLTPGDYDGVQIYRFGTLMTELTALEALEWTDTKGESGEKYRYNARTFVEDYRGNRTYGDQLSEPVEETYPTLDPPGYFGGEQLNGKIQLTWADDDSGRNYIIKSFEENIGDVTDKSGVFVVEDGEPGDDYIYQIYSYLESGELSTTYNSVNLEYPLPAEVSNLTAVADVATNSIKLSWEYNEDAGIVAIDLYREDNIIGQMITADEEGVLQSTFEDSRGIPGVLNKFEIKTYRDMDGEAVSSAGASISIMYPDLPEITSHTYITGTDMVDTLKWTYNVTNFDGFEVTTTRVATGESTTQYIEVTAGVVDENGDTVYKMELTGMSGATYAYSLVPMATRNEALFEAAPYAFTQDYQELNSTTLAVVANGQDYVLLNWEYDIFGMEAWELEIDKDGTIETVTLNDIGQRFYFHRITHQSSADYSFRIRALADDSQGDAKHSAWSTSTSNYTLSHNFGSHTSLHPVYKDHGSWYKEVNFANALEGVTATSLTVDRYKFIDAYTQLSGLSEQTMVVKTEHIYIHPFFGSMEIDASNASFDFTYDDLEPNVQYLYVLSYVESGATHSTGVQVKAENTNGEITGLVSSSLGTGIRDVEVQLVGEFDGQYVFGEYSTDSQGNYFFGDLPYDKVDGKNYTISAVTAGRDFDPSSVEVPLAFGLNEKIAETIIDNSNVVIKGTMTYNGEIASGQPVKVTVFGVNEFGESTELNVLVGQIGSYSVPVQLHSEFSQFKVKIEPENPNGQEDEVFTNYEVTEQFIETAELNNGDEIEVDFLDKMLIPTTITMMEGSCEYIDDYVWKLYLSEVGGSYNSVINVNGPIVTLDLPPVNFEVRVGDVSPLNSYSKEMLSSFRSPITIAHGDSLIQYTKDHYNEEVTASEIPADEDAFKNEYVFTYYHKIELDLTFDNIERCIQSSNEEVLHAAYGSDTEVTIQIQPKLITTNGTSCDINVGKVKIKNFAKKINNDNSDDSIIEYVDEITGWKTYTFSPGNINTAPPYKRAIELYYYDDNDNFVSLKQVDVIVTGTKSLEGTDFFLDTDPNLIPLFVLRDPPGDGSFSTIHQGSTFNYQFIYGHEHAQTLTLGTNGKSLITNVGWQVDNEITLKTMEGEIRDRGFSLTFTEDLSTSAEAPFFFDQDKYMLGKYSDIVVGIGSYDTYSVARNIGMNNCEVKETITYTVTPGRITQWSMTRSQLQQNVKYYDLLMSDNTVEFSSEEGGYKDKSEVLNDKKKNLEAIISYIDNEYTIPVKACSALDRMLAVNGNKFHPPLHRLIPREEIRQEIRDELGRLSDFCNANVGSRSERKLNDNFWNSINHDDLDEFMDRFVRKLRQYEYLVAFRKTKPLDLEVPLSLFDNSFPRGTGGIDAYKNVSFSAGLSHTVNLTSNFTSGSSNSVNFLPKFKRGWKYISGTDFNISLWTGVGAGTYVDTGKEYSSELSKGGSVAFDGNFSIAQVSSESESYSTSYTLQDDDPGDQFNVGILHDPFTKHANSYLSSAEFHLISGRSSCPWEYGTIKRDDFTISLVNEDGSPAPSQVEVDGDDLLVFYIQVQNQAPFYEYRRAAMTGGPNTGMYGETVMANGNFPIHAIFPSAMFTTGTEPLRFKATLSKIFAPAVKGTVLFRPYVGAFCNVVDLATEHTAYTELTMVFIRSTSPVSLPTSRGNWLINSRTGNDFRSLSTLGIELKDLRPDDDLYQLQSVNVLARPMHSAQNDWVMLKNTDNKTSISREELSNGETVFQWAPNADEFPQGPYQLKAAVIGEEGGYEESNLWDGRIDMLAPFAATLPEPADGLLSKGDGIGVKMNEDISAGVIYGDRDTYIEINIYEIDDDDASQNPVYSLVSDTDPALSDYTVSVNESNIDFVINDSILSVYDGHWMKVSLLGIEDEAFNQADDIVWMFKLDPSQVPVSEISLVANDELDDQGVLWLNDADDRTAVKFFAADFDVYNKTSSLLSVDLQYRNGAPGQPGQWSSLGSKSIQNLRDDDIEFEIDFASNDFGDGMYDLRLKATGSNGTRASNIIEVVVDTKAPKIVDKPELLEHSTAYEFELSLSESVRQVGEVEFSAEINGESFEAISGYVHDNVITLQMDQEHADFEDLYTSYALDLELAFSNITDFAGNSLVEPVAVVIGNYSNSVSKIAINTESWLINSENEEVEFFISDYDVLETISSLDSIQIVYREQNGFQNVAIDTLQKEELRSFNDPFFYYIWDLSGESVPDGNYNVYAICWGDNGKSYYSNAASGTIDRTPPEYVGIQSPSGRSFSEADGYFSFEYSEPLHEDISEDVEVSHLNNGTPITINESLYHLVLQNNIIKVIPTESFLVTYSEDTIQIYLDNVSDVYGNLAQEDHYFDFEMYEYSGSSSRLATNLTGEALGTGEVQVSWTSYASYKSSTLERSRDGRSFIDIATYDGELTDSHMDKVNFSNVIFYRLRQVTEDSSVYYSKAIIVENDNTIAILAAHLYPNPSNGKEFELSILTNNLESELQLSVIDIHGKEVYREAIDAQSVLHSNVSFELKTPLKTGIYQILLNQGDKRSQHKLVVVSDGQP